MKSFEQWLIDNAKPPAADKSIDPNKWRYFIRCSKCHEDVEVTYEKFKSHSGWQTSPIVPHDCWKVKDAA